MKESVSWASWPAQLVRWTACPEYQLVPLKAGEYDSSRYRRTDSNRPVPDRPGDVCERSVPCARPAGGQRFRPLFGAAPARVCAGVRPPVSPGHTRVLMLLRCYRPGSASFPCPSRARASRLAIAGSSGALEASLRGGWGRDAGGGGGGGFDRRDVRAAIDDRLFTGGRLLPTPCCSSVARHWDPVCWRDWCSWSGATCSKMTSVLAYVRSAWGALRGWLAESSIVHRRVGVEPKAERVKELEASLPTSIQATLAHEILSPRQPLPSPILSPTPSALWAHPAGQPLQLASSSPRA